MRCEPNLGGRFFVPTRAAHNLPPAPHHVARGHRAFWGQRLRLEIRLEHAYCILPSPSVTAPGLRVLLCETCDIEGQRGPGEMKCVGHRRPRPWARRALNPTSCHHVSSLWDSGRSNHVLWPHFSLLNATPTSSCPPPTSDTQASLPPELSQPAAAFPTQLFTFFRL